MCLDQRVWFLPTGRKQYPYIPVWLVSPWFLRDTHLRDIVLWITPVWDYFMQSWKYPVSMLEYGFMEISWSLFDIISIVPLFKNFLTQFFIVMSLIELDIAMQRMWEWSGPRKHKITTPDSRFLSISVGFYCLFVIFSCFNKYSLGYKSKTPFVLKSVWCYHFSARSFHKWQINNKQ